jgi:hypothetical protein
MHAHVNVSLMLSMTKYSLFCKENAELWISLNNITSVADPDYFCSEPDPNFQNVQNPDPDVNTFFSSFSREYLSLKDVQQSWFIIWVSTIFTAFFLHQNN